MIFLKSVIIILDCYWEVMSMDIGLMIMVLEFIGTIAFAISGALIAIENRMDIFGVIVLGTVTAVGGGFLRDIIIHKSMPSIFINPIYVIVAVATTIIVFIIMHFIKGLKFVNSTAYRFGFNITDSLGLGTFVVVGANVVMEMDKSTTPFLIIFCSVITAVGGGMIRDILASRIPVIFVKHIYAVAAIIGALFFYTFINLNVWYPVVAVVTILIVVVIRFLAFFFKWNLPRINLKK